MTGLVARESIEMANVVAYGSGRLSPRAAGDISRGWKRDAGITQKAMTTRAGTPAPLFGGMGIEYEAAPESTSTDGRR